MQYKNLYFSNSLLNNGFVAQWITRLPTEQKIPGSTPGRLEILFSIFESFSQVYILFNII